MCVAVPLLEDDAWHVHSLGADGGSVASALDVAVTTLGARRVIGTTAWSARDLAVHASLGPLEVLTAWTPAHTDPATLTYRVDIGTAPGVSPTTHVASGDHEALRRLQASIESGCRYRVVGPPGDDGRVPLAQDA